MFPVHVETESLRLERLCHDTVDVFDYYDVVSDAEAPTPTSTDRYRTSSAVAQATYAGTTAATPRASSGVSARTSVSYSSPSASAVGVSPWVAVVVVAVVFGVSHLPHGRGGVPVTTVLGLGWGATFVVGGLLAAAAAHVVVNVGELAVNGWLDAELRPDLHRAG
jgi:hypothetical protein